MSVVVALGSDVVSCASEASGDEGGVDETCVG